MFFIFFEWKNNIVEQSFILYTTSPWSIGAGLCGVFLTLHKAYTLIRASVTKVKKQKKKLKARRSIRKTPHTTYQHCACSNSKHDGYVNQDEDRIIRCHQCHGHCIIENMPCRSNMADTVWDPSTQRWRIRRYNLLVTDKTQGFVFWSFSHTYMWVNKDLRSCEHTHLMKENIWFRFSDPLMSINIIQAHPRVEQSNMSIWRLLLQLVSNLTQVKIRPYNSIYTKYIVIIHNTFT